MPFSAYLNSTSAVPIIPIVEEKRCGDWGHEQIARGGALILHDAESSDKWELNLFFCCLLAPKGISIHAISVISVNHNK